MERHCRYLGLLAVLALPVSAHAEPYETGGVQLSFGVSTRVDYQSNAALDQTDPGATHTARTRFSVGLDTETRTEKFTFAATADVKKGTGPNTLPATGGLTTPRLAVAYDRTAAHGHLLFSAAILESDLAQPSDTYDRSANDAVIRGTAKQRASHVQLGLFWGDDTAIGFGVLARWEKTGFRDGIAVGVGGVPLNDATKRELKTTFRLDLDQVTSLKTTVGFRSLDSGDHTAPRRSSEIFTTLRRTRPLGDLEIALGYTHTPDGNRVESSIGQFFDLPAGQVYASLGATRAVFGGTLLTGALRFSQSAPAGQFDAGVIRAVAMSDQTGAERVNTDIDASFGMEITPAASLLFRFDWSHAMDTSSRLGTTNASLGVTYSRSLTRDVKIDFGLRHRLLRDDLAGKARTSEVFISVARAFVARY